MIKVHYSNSLTKWTKESLSINVFEPDGDKGNISGRGAGGFNKNL